MRTRDSCRLEFELDEAVRRGGLVVLGELVILRGVRVEIILPVKLGEARDLAVQQIAGQHGQAKRLLVGDGQHARHAEADGADVGVRRRAECIRAPAPHLGLGLELNVGFQPDDGFVFHNGAESLTTDPSSIATLRRRVDTDEHGFFARDKLSSACPAFAAREEKRCPPDLPADPQPAWKRADDARKGTSLRYPLRLCCTTAASSASSKRGTPGTSR